MTTHDATSGARLTQDPKETAEADLVDQLRREDFILASIPRMMFQKVLHLGCADGTLTARLPGADVLGVAPPSRPLPSACSPGAAQKRLTFASCDVNHLQLNPATAGPFNLVVITGSLDAAAGASFSIAWTALAQLTSSGSYIIHDRTAQPGHPTLPFRRIDQLIYRLENKLQTLELFVA